MERAVMYSQLTTTQIPITSDDTKSNVFTEEGSTTFITSNDIEWLISIPPDGGEELGTAESQKPKIQQVPKMLRHLYREDNCFDPMIVSIGPYHHGKPELQLAEKIKITTARQFVWGRSNKNVDAFYKSVAEVSSNARACYTADSTTRFSDKEFADMMFLDGCFILNLIDCMMNKKREGIKMKCHHIAFVLRDLFLLENQLPFVVLQALMSMKFPEDQGIAMVKAFIKQRIRAPESVSKESVAEPLHLLELMRTELLGRSSTTDSPLPEGAGGQTFRSVNELKTAGIKFKKSNTSCFNDISFKPGIISGTLRLPPVAIDDSSKAKFLNLIAYEACPDTPDDYGITSYICFMDKLIDLPSDVKELRSKGIVQNFVGSDEEVAKLFNEIATELVPNPQTYATVGDGIEKIYKNKRISWMTEICHKNCSTPWKIIALLAGIYVLVLSTVQTHFTILPLKND